MSGSYDDMILVKVPAQGSTRSAPWGEPLLHSTRLTGIYVSYSDCTLFSIQMVYQRGAELLLGENHGGGYGTHFEYIELAAREVITCVRGQLGLAKIHRLELETNVGAHGPFGSRRSVTDGRDFCFSVGGQFAGFHGHSDGASLSSIGVYVNTGASGALVCPAPSSSSGNLVTYSSEERRSHARRQATAPATKGSQSLATQ